MTESFLWCLHALHLLISFLEQSLNDFILLRLHIVLFIIVIFIMSLSKRTLLRHWLLLRLCWLIYTHAHIPTHCCRVGRLQMGIVRSIEAGLVILVTWTGKFIEGSELSSWSSWWLNVILNSCNNLPLLIVVEWTLEVQLSGSFGGASIRFPSLWYWLRVLFSLNHWHSCLSFRP